VTVLLLSLACAPVDFVSYTGKQITDML